MRHWCAVNKTDAQVCDCCGDGTEWYGIPGLHDLNNPDEPFPDCY